MEVEQLKWSTEGWGGKPPRLGKKANLVTVFGSRELLLDQKLLEEIKNIYPNAIRVGCTTAGEIYDTQVRDNTLSIAAISFKHTKLKAEVIDIKADDSFKAGKTIKDRLFAKDLAHLFVLSDGLGVNGSELVKGLTEDLPKNVAVTGGLAGDGNNFKQTLIYFDNSSKSGRLAAVGFYSDKLKVSYSSFGGWDTYGTVKEITKSEGNILFELDGTPALDLYKMYLGDRAKELPSSALLFPLNLVRNKDDEPVVRTILSINNEAKTMTFGGDMPVGGKVQFMKANMGRLVEAAAKAAASSQPVKDDSDLAILISCVGRKLVLNQRVEEEVEAVREVLGKKPFMTGFYSYGEISPFSSSPNASCELHNQTMTITTFKEEK